MTPRSAQRLRTLAVRLRSLPVCAQAYAEGCSPAARSRPLSPGSTTSMAEMFAAQEAELVPYLIP